MSADQMMTHNTLDCACLRMALWCLQVAPVGNHSTKKLSVPADSIGCVALTIEQQLILLQSMLLAR